MWGTEYVAAPPQQHQGNVSICNRYRVIGPLDVTDRDLSAAANLPSQSVTVTRQKPGLTVTDQDKRERSVGKSRGTTTSASVAPLSAHTTGVSIPQPDRPAVEFPPTSSSQPASPDS